MNYKKGSGAPSFQPAGTYQFEVVEAVNARSKPNPRYPKGNDMISLTLEIQGGTTVFDHLVDNPKSIWKIDEFVECTQLVVAGDELDASDCLGATGLVKLGLGESNTGRTRNEVLQYMPAEIVRRTATATTAPAKAAAPTMKSGDPALTPEPDDIPF
jgi:hypothetical protein